MVILRGLLEIGIRRMPRSDDLGRRRPLGTPRSRLFPAFLSTWCHPLLEIRGRCLLKMFVKRELMDIGTAQSMLNWPHSGFHVHDAVWAPADDKEFTIRLARYCAR